MPATLLRGRAASAVRVGKIIKDVLSGKLPNEEGRLVSESAVVDLHHVYKREVRKQNMLRKKKLKPMVYSSFTAQLRFAYKLGLIELVRKEDMLFPPPNGHLYSFIMGDHNRGEISKRHIYRLTEIGKQDELSWTNLTRAYIERWVAPQAAPEYTVTAKPYKFSVIPSYDNIIAFRKHIETADLTEEQYKDYSRRVGDWALYFEDRAESSRNIHYRELFEDVNQLTDLLYSQNKEAILALLAAMATTLAGIHEESGKKTRKERVEQQELQQEQGIGDTEQQEPGQLEALKSRLHGILDPEQKSASITQLEFALDDIDEEIYSGIEDIRNAIEEYSGIEREGKTPVEYGEEKQEAFEEIDNAIDNIELLEEEDNE